jgi:hypothetical protein
VSGPRDLSLPKPNVITMKPNDDDWKLVVALRKHEGVDVSQILRMALRELARSRGVIAA